jgi:hypothetical protein
LKKRYEIRQRQITESDAKPRGLVADARIVLGILSDILGRSAKDMSEKLNGVDLYEI